METINARGPNFVYAKEYIEKKYGEQTWEKILNALPEEAAKIWRGTIMVGGAYPFSAFKAMVNILSKEVKFSEKMELSNMYEYIADRSLNKLYKIFFSFGNPSFVIKNYPRLWARFFTSGRVEVPIATKKHAVLKFTLDEIFSDWLAPACLGYSRKAVEMAGGKNLRIEQMNKNSLENNTFEINYALKWE